MSVGLEPMLASVRDAVEDIARADAIPGVAIGLARGDERVAAGVGVTNIHHPLEVTSTTMFQLASISKIFTATAAVIMAERGELSLAQPIVEYLPDLRLADDECRARLTLEDLLCHRAGWPGDFDVDTGRGDDALERLADTWAAAPQWAPVGTTFSYSNLGYGLAGWVIERVAGEPFDRVVTREVIEPLGLARTTFLLEEVAFERWAGGHRKRNGAVEHAPWWRPRSRGPNGGVLSCVEDLLTFGAFHLSDAAEPLGPGPRADMRAPRIRDSLDTQIGLGWMVQRWGPVDAVVHHGGSYGFATMLVLFPATGLVMTVLSNAAFGGAIEAASRAVVRAAFDAEIEPNPTDASAIDHDEVVGRYEGQNATLVVGSRAPDLTVDLVVDGASAGSADAPPTMTLRPVARDAVAVEGAGLGGRYATFVRGEDGTVRFLRAGRRLFRRID